MDWKRKIELTCGLITAVLGVILMLLNLRIEQAAAQILQEPGHMAKAFVLFLAVDGLPSALVALGAYA
ncbi:MAG: hypothetical protein LC775_16685, partial [Acidobacteria bacterium]|nr:hypothetical protein [Acidobacteriota bacterium]